MIFKSINRLESKAEKSFCKEQIQVYIRLVEVYCEKNNLQFLSEKSDKYIDELMDIGIIENPDEINDLIEFAGMLYEKFEVAVNFAIANKEQIGDLLDNLYNSKRKEAQEKADKEKKINLSGFLLWSRRIEPWIFTRRISCKTCKRYRRCVYSDI